MVLSHEGDMNNCPEFHFNVFQNSEQCYQLTQIDIIQPRIVSPLSINPYQ